MTTYTTVSVCHGPPGYLGRRRRRKPFAPTTKAFALLITFWFLGGSIGLTAAVGMWAA